MRRSAGIVLAVVCGLTSGSAWAQGQPPAQPPAGEAASLQPQLDELKKKLGELEERLKGQPSAQEVEALKQELSKLQGELARLSEGARKAEERLSGVEGALKPAESGEDDFEVDVSGFVRVGYESIEDNTEQTNFVGLNDGFLLSNARIMVDGFYGEKLHFRAQLDGAVDQRDAFNSASGELTTRVRDAFLEYRQDKWLVARLGQFKPPFDAEEKRSTADILFPTRAVESVGVRGVEGRNVRGLSVDRDTGLMLYSDPLVMEDTGLGLAYFVSVVNGSGSSQPLNDNDALAGFGRLELYWEREASSPRRSNPDAAVPGDLQERAVTLGVGGFYNKRTTGQAPDQFNEERVGLAADLELRLYGAILQGQFIQWNTSFLDVDVNADRTAQGFHVALGYEAPFGLTPAYRFASFDPTSDFQAADPVVTQQLDTDELTYHTVGLTWDVFEMPLRLQTSYTFTVENDARALDNDRFECVGQLIF